ncbi:MAG TPA: GNAT family N-acetyltransferase [Methylomirabilota bacterium]|nr:GNAT family N-acetyltransferase [Methylomirabilota bacterium]
MSPGRFTCRVVEALEAVPAHLWDQLVPGASLHLSHAWLRCVEEVAQGRYRAWYLLVVSPGGDVVAALPCYLVENPRHYALYNPFDVMGCPAAPDGVLGSPGGSGCPVEPGREAFFPALLCGSAMAYASALLLDARRPQAERDFALGLLVDEVERLSRQLGARTVAFPYVSETQATRLRAALPAGYAGRLVAAGCLLPLGFTTFDGYLARFGAGRRRAIRRELAQFESGGLRARLRGLEGCAEALPPLLARVQRKYGHEANLARIGRSMATYARHLGPLSRVFLAERHGDPVGFALFFSWRGRYHARMVGFDYERLGRTACYFNLLFYHPVQQALRERATAIDYGVESYEAKASRGCDLHPLHWLVRPPEAWRDTLVAEHEAQGPMTDWTFRTLAARFGRTWHSGCAAR